MTGPAVPVGFAPAAPSPSNIFANGSEIGRAEVLSRIGLAVAPVWMFHKEAAEGLVTAVPADDEAERLPIHLVYPSRRLIAAKVRAVSDFLVEEIRAEPALIGGSGRAPTALTNVISG